jgi:hypothetical protein
MVTDETSPIEGDSGGQMPDWLTEVVTTPASEEIESGDAMDASEASKPEAAEEAAVERDLTEPVPAEPVVDAETATMVDDRPIEPAPQEDGTPPEKPEDKGQAPATTPPKAPAGDVEEMEPAELAGWLESLSEEPMMEEWETDETDASSELPEWLQAVTLPEGKDGESDDTSPEEGALPDWLQALSLEETEQASEDELSHWTEKTSVDEQSDDDETALAPPEPLVSQQPKAQAPEQPGSQRPSRRAPSTGPLVPDELKEWLGQTIGPEDEEALEDQPRVKGTGPLVPPELPDWLAAVEEIPATGELPGWLLQEEENELGEEKVASEPPTIERPRTGPLPSWLTDDLGPATEEGEPEAAPGEIPDWLQPPPDMVDTGLARAEVPTWLLPPEESTTPASDASPMADFPAWPGEEEPSLDDEPGLVAAVIPDWLQALKPEETTTEPGLPAGEQEKVETEGPLSGVRGALPIEGAIITPPDTRPLPKFVVTEQQHSHVQVLEQIIHGGPEPKPEPAPARSPQWWVERGLIPILILAAVLVPAFLAYMGQPLDLPIATQERSEVGELYTLIESLPLSATVVMAFDYSPSAAGELDAVAAPLVRHLMFRQARILGVSTVPAGPQLAQSALDAAAKDYGYEYGTDFLVLGYIPGGAVGLQAFATAPWELFAGGDFLGPQRAEAEGRDPLAQHNGAAAGLDDSLRSADLILLLTASREDLVGWMEQVGRLPGMEGVPIVGGLSAGLEPWARPYYETDANQLAGLLSGVPAAAEYAQRVAPQQPASMMGLRESQTAGLVVVALFIVIGLVWGGAVGLSSRSKDHG